MNAPTYISFAKNIYIFWRKHIYLHQDWLTNQVSRHRAPENESIGTFAQKYRYFSSKVSVLLIFAVCHDNRYQPKEGKPYLCAHI